MNSILLIALCCLSLVAAIPNYAEGRQTTISSLVGPTAAYIEALFNRREPNDPTESLSLLNPGQPGNLTVMPNSQTPALFYVHRNQLWMYHNETSIFPVNAVNSTQATGLPLRLEVGAKLTSESKNSVWRWRGTMLYYDHGSAGNSGLYYFCRLSDGSDGIFMFLQPSATPENCRAFTMHSWSRSHINPYKS